MSHCEIYKIVNLINGNIYLGSSNNLYRLGVIPSEETRAKLSDAQKRRRERERALANQAYTERV